MIKNFQKKILTFYKKNGRHCLPFRKTTNPYRIFVAEIMLQQTQVERVIPYFAAWIKKWPSWNALSAATNREVLRVWSGLGYNKRALNLRDAARDIGQLHQGKLPDTIESLRLLPGVGPYTANAVRIFALNSDEVTVDTNIRRVLIHELHLSPNITQKKLWELAWRVLPRGRSRDWHNALMDYAALMLPRTPRIKPLSRQSRFEGSVRQIRGAIIRELTKKESVSRLAIIRKTNRSSKDVMLALMSLKKNGMISMRGQRIRLA